MDAPPDATARLDLRPLTAAAIEAFIPGDADRLEAVTGASFRRPLHPPPLAADDLPGLLAYVREAPAAALPRLLALRATGEAVGIAGLSALGAEGTVEVGYAVYPEHEGRG